MDSKLTNSNVCAIILAAGYSSRMKGFKPLLKFGKMTLLGKLIETYKKSNVGGIIVVTGYNNIQVEKEAAKFDGVSTVFNENFHNGMYSSVLKGVRAALDLGYKGYTIHPVDCPVVRTITINKLLSEFCNREVDVVSPLFRGCKGHPVLVSSRISDSLFEYCGENGLRGALDSIELRMFDVEVRDSYILDDIDRDDEYYQSISRRNNFLLDKDRSIELMKTFDVERKVLEHCKKVAEVSLIIAERLNEYGLGLDLDLIQMAAIVHDIKRECGSHALEGEFVLSDLGYFDIADIVSEHMNLISNKGMINEKHIVYFSDKIVREAEVVALEERFEYKVEKYRNSYLYDKVLKKYVDALEIKGRIEMFLGESIYNMVMESEKKNDLFNEACRDGIV